MFTRRQLLAGAAAFPFAAALAGCAGTTAAGSALQQAISDAGLIASSLAAALPGIAASVGLTESTLAAVNAALGDIKTAAAAIAGAASASAAQPSAAQLAAAFNALLAALDGVALPASISTALAAASALLPGIETAVGIAVAIAAARPAMTPTQARAILAALAGGAR